MPKFKPDVLRPGWGIRCLTVRQGAAKRTRVRLWTTWCDSNLFGHDSHGAIRFYEYAKAVQDGRFNPDASPEVISERACTAVVDGRGSDGAGGGDVRDPIGDGKSPPESALRPWHCASTSHIREGG